MWGSEPSLRTVVKTMHIEQPRKKNRCVRQMAQIASCSRNSLCTDMHGRPNTLPLNVQTALVLMLQVRPLGARTGDGI